MYNLCNRIINVISLIFRIKRLCFQKYIEQTNCNNLIISESNPDSILSWNIQSMFYFTTPLKVKNIIRYIEKFDYDVVCLQEVFEDNVKRKIIEKLEKKYPYYLIGKTIKKNIIGEDSGLLVLSKYNINFIKEIEFNDNVCPDIMARKTVIYFTIGDYNFSNAHIHSNNCTIAEKHLQESIYQSPFNEYFMVGDLNHNSADKVLNVENNNKEPTWKNEILDYILPIGYKDIKLDVSVIKMDLTNVSDHLPIQSKIKKI